MAQSPAPDTIFAPASGFGRAAVTVIRISGPAAGTVLIDLAGSLPEPRRLSLRTLRDPADSAILDKALVAWMPGPNTFTGEDMAELHLHGGLAVRAAVLRALAQRSRCGLAEPGAFTRRAFLNGRLDLTEAEGIADLVDAETEAQRRQAMRQLDGVLGRQVDAWRDRAIDLLAMAEAALDFSDEGDVDDTALDTALLRDASQLRDEIGGALRDNRRGERLREGFTVVLAGAPNAGKSTLLNVLSRRDAAIVSEIPGTTRDAIEVHCDLDGLPVILIDTAGLRETYDVVEVEGIARTRRRIANADLVLHLIAADEPSGELAAPGTPTIDVMTKADLVTGAANGGIAVSALTGSGLETLIDAVRGAAQAALGGTALITRQRHREALERAQSHLDRLVMADQAGLPELRAEDLRLAVRALGEIGGHVSVEAMLDRLFAGFCIGK